MITAACSVHLLDRPVPPSCPEQALDVVGAEARSSQTCRISGDDLVGCNVLRDNAACADHSSVTDRDARHDGRFAPNPHIVAHDCVATLLDLHEHVERVARPRAAERDCCTDR